MAMKRVEEMIFFDNDAVSPFEVDYGNMVVKFNTVSHMLKMMEINVVKEYGNEAYLLTLNSGSKVSKLDGKNLDKYFDFLVGRKRVQRTFKMQEDWKKISKYILFIATLEKLRQNPKCKQELYDVNLNNLNFNRRMFIVIYAMLKAEDEGYQILGFKLDKTGFTDIKVSRKYYDLRFLDSKGFITDTDINNIWVYSATQNGQKYLFNSY